MITGPSSTKVQEKVIVEAKTIHIPQFHVILLDDDDHTYDYVIEMITQVFGHSHQKAYELACKVDANAFVVVDTTHKDRAELKRDQIHEFGIDWRIRDCKGSMSAIIEPAETMP